MEHAGKQVSRQNVLHLQNISIRTAWLKDSQVKTALQKNVFVDQYYQYPFDNYHKYSILNLSS